MHCQVFSVLFIPFVAATDMLNVAPEITMQRIAQTTGFSLAKTNLRITKYNRTCAVLNGTMDLLVDLDDNYTFQMRAAYSRIGNNQFNEYPMKLAEQPVCQFMQGTYRVFQEKHRDNTNLPQVTHSLDSLPAVIPEGYWRLSFLLGGPDDTMELQVFVILSRGTFG